MHELSVCQAILHQAAGIARAHGGRVKRINLSVGPLAGVEPLLLKAAFPLVATGSVCEGAALAIQTPAVRVECQICGAASHVKPNRLLCGACGAWRVALLAGDEMRIESLELFETEAANV